MPATIWLANHVVNHKPFIYSLFKLIAIVGLNFFPRLGTKSDFHSFPGGFSNNHSFMYLTQSWHIQELAVWMRTHKYSHFFHSFQEVLNEEPSCCPCLTSSSMSYNSDCIPDNKIRKLTRLFQRSRRIALKAIEGCGGNVVGTFCHIKFWPFQWESGIWFSISAHIHRTDELAFHRFPQH